MRAKARFGINGKNAPIGNHRIGGNPCAFAIAHANWRAPYQTGIIAFPQYGCLISAMG